MKTIPFKYKLIISILAMGIIPLVINSIYSLKSSKAELERAALEKLTAVREIKNQSITRYLDSLNKQIVTLAHDKMMVDAAKEFLVVFNHLPPGTEEERSKLQDYYSKDFAAEYKKIVSQDSPLENVVSKLAAQNVTIQNAFISSNPNPLGSKHLLDESPLVPEYSNVHKNYHPILREYLETFGLYDIFIIDINNGNIIYTVFKELDFSTSLLTGPYQDSNLAEVFRQARELTGKKDFKIIDFKKYTPSYEAPASFIATPIWDGDKKIGVLAFQMPLATINQIMGERAGLGETGEVYLVGGDKKLRSDIHTNKDFNIYNSFNKKKEISTPNIEMALNNKPGALITKNFDEVDVLSSFNKLAYPHLSWAIVAEQSTSEAFASINKLLWNVVIFIVISAIIIVILSYYITNKLSTQIGTVVESFSASAHDVQNSSQKMALISNKLYKSVQVQISSITESAAAMDEISATLKNNIVSAENASKLSQTSKVSALRGKETVDNMMMEVKAISSSYDNIQQSINKNNEDINKIVHVISDIAQKTKVINDIVFQTKLLSFNASVEAARAGESGKGFAVVAEEIANLASMSGKAANDISEMLTASQEQVQTIAEETKKHIGIILVDGREKVENGTNVALMCMTELDNILKSVEELDSSIREISAAVFEQSNGVNEVNSAMKYLENATHETTDMSERSKAASKDLNEQSLSLRASIQELRKILDAKKNYDAPKEFRPLEE